jgi:hypothetical protein
MNTSIRTIAQLVLAFLLLGTAAAAQDSHPAPAQTTTFVVLADRHIQDHLWPILVSTLSRDATAQSETAPVSGNLQIILGGGDTPGPAFPSRIEVELIGRCDSPWDHNANMLPNKPLGWVLGKPGEIAPVIYVDCAQIDQMLWPSMRSMPESQQLRATSEAISHIVLHEWIHIATQSPAHAERGIMQPELTASELMTPIATNEKLARENSTPASRPKRHTVKTAQANQSAQLTANPQWIMANPFSLDTERGVNN